MAITLTHDQQRDLVKLLSDSFNSREFKDLAFNYGIDLDNLGVSGPRAASREIVLHAVRHIKVEDLLKAVQTAREDLGLPLLDLSPYGYKAGPDGGGKEDEEEEEGTLAAAAMEFANFDLRVGMKGADGRYPVEVTRNPDQIDMAQPVRQEFDPEDYDFADLVSYLEDLLARSEDAVALGKKMHEFLFPEEVERIFFTNRTSMRREGKGLRIRLRIDAPELSGLPWEYCHGDTFFGLQRDTPIVRYIPRPFAPDELTAPDPMKVVVAISAPKDQAPLSVRQEERRIRNALAFMGEHVTLNVLPHATASSIQGALATRPHIFHFIGHGTVEDGRASIILEDGAGKSAPLDADQMMYLMGNTGVRVVVLNACKTAKQDARNAIMGVAPALVHAEIPAVIAMQFNVPDKTALGFTRDLYRFLVSGFPLDTAVTEMRIGAFIGAGDRYFWGIPALFMRAPDGVIWQPDAELMKRFEEAQMAAADMGEPDFPALIEEIASKFGAIEDELDPKDVRYVSRDLDDLRDFAQEDEPRLRYVERSLEGVRDGLRNSDLPAAAEIVTLVQQAEVLAQELYGEG